MSIYFIGDINSEYDNFLKEKYIFNLFLNDENLLDNILYSSFIDYKKLFYQLYEIGKNKDNKLIIILSKLNTKLIYNKLKNVYLNPDLYYLYKNNNIEKILDNHLIQDNTISIIKNSIEIDFNQNIINDLINTIKKKFKVENILIQSINQELKYPLFDLKLYSSYLFDKELMNNNINDTIVGYYGILFNKLSKYVNLKNNTLLYNFKFDSGEMKINSKFYYDKNNKFNKDLNLNVDLSYHLNNYLSIYTIDNFYDLENNNLLIFCHSIFSKDGTSLEMRETINELFEYYNNIKISVITVGENNVDYNNNYNIYKSYSKNGSCFNIYNINININCLSNKLYLLFFHNIFLELFNLIKPNITFSCYQCSIVYNHFIILSKIFNNLTLMRWSGSLLNNNELKELLTNAIKNSDYIIKIGEKLIDINIYNNKIVKHFSTKLENYTKKNDNELLKIKNYYNIDKNKFVFLTIGRICKVKNIHTIIKSFLSFKYYQQSILLIVGKINDVYYYNDYIKYYIDNYKNSIKHLEVNPNEINNLIYISNCFIFIPSSGEGMARSLLEVLNLNKPAIVDIKNNFNYLEYCSKDYCIFVNYDNQNEITNSITEMYLNNKKYINFNNINFKKYSLKTYKNLFDSWFIFNNLLSKFIIKYDNNFLINDNNYLYILNNNEIFKYNNNININNDFFIILNLNIIQFHKTLLIDNIENYDEINYDYIILYNKNEFLKLNIKEFNKLIILNQYSTDYYNLLFLNNILFYLITFNIDIKLSFNSIFHRLKKYIMSYNNIIN